MPLQLLTILSPTTPCIPILLLTVLSRDRSRRLPLSLHGTVSVLGFATDRQARQCIRPNRVHHCLVYGLVIRFRLLSTPSLDDAVAFGYGQTSASVRQGLSPYCWCALSGAPVPGTSCQATIVLSLRDISQTGSSQSQRLADIQRNA
jgi:hypothetical protein